MITKLTVVFILLSSVHASADGFGHEQAVVTGKVTDENGAALAGVSVQIKGTNKGAATNSTGVFSINASDNDVLVFSYVGYETQQVAVAGKTEVNVTLAPAKSTSLEQVVVIGYGTAQKKRFNRINCES